MLLSPEAILSRKQAGFKLSLFGQKSLESRSPPAKPASPSASSSSPSASSPSSFPASSSPSSNGTLLLPTTPPPASPKPASVSFFSPPSLSSQTPLYHHSLASTPSPSSSSSPFVVRAPYFSTTPPASPLKDRGSPVPTLLPALIDDPIEAELFFEEQRRFQKSNQTTLQFGEELRQDASVIHSTHHSIRVKLDEQDRMVKESLFRGFEKTRGPEHQKLLQDQEYRHQNHQILKEVGDAMVSRQNEERRRLELLRRAEEERQRQEELRRQEETRRRELDRIRLEQSKAEESKRTAALLQMQKTDQERLRAQALAQRPPGATSIAISTPQKAQNGVTPTHVTSSSGPWHELSSLYLPMYKEILAFQQELLQVKETHDKNMQQTVKREIARSINLILNTLSSSLESVRLKIKEIIQLVQKSDQSDPLIGLYCRRIFAKKCLAQVDRLGLQSENIGPVFPLARLVRELCTLDHLTARVFQATFARVCPYTIPVYLPKEGGARRQTSGSIEADTAFFGRMESYIVFFMAISQFHIRAQGKQLPPQIFDLESSWCWFARLLNTHPTRISPVILRGALKAAGYQMHRAYGPQFEKLLRLAYSDYVAILSRTQDPLIPEISNVKTLIEIALKKRAYPKPDGYDLQ